MSITKCYIFIFYHKIYVVINTICKTLYNMMVDVILTTVRAIPSMISGTPMTFKSNFQISNKCSWNLQICNTVFLNNPFCNLKDSNIFETPHHPLLFYMKNNLCLEFICEVYIDDFLCSLMS